MLRELLCEYHPCDTLPSAALAEDADVPAEGAQRDFQIGFERADSLTGGERGAKADFRFVDGIGQVDSSADPIMNSLSWTVSCSRGRPPASLFGIRDTRAS